VPVPTPAAPRLPPQILSEFAAETDVPGSPARSIHVWRLAASIVLAAITAVSIAAFWYVYFATRTLDGSAEMLPAAPAWRTALETADLPPPIEEVAANLALPVQTATAPVARTPSTPAYVIQVASFESRVRAERLVEELTGAGFRARSVEFDLGPRGRLYQVRVDGYRTLDESSRDLARIRQLAGYADAHLLAN
jgi:cell division septation protein DedD